MDPILFLRKEVADLSSSEYGPIIRIRYYGSFIYLLNKILGTVFKKTTIFNTFI